MKKVAPGASRAYGVSSPPPEKLCPITSFRTPQNHHIPNLTCAGQQLIVFAARHLQYERHNTQTQ